MTTSISKQPLQLSITQHAYARARERFSFTKYSIDRMAARALQQGLCRKETKGQMRKYFDRLWLQYHKAGNIRLYGEMLFLFQGHTLITVWQLPNHLRPLAKALAKGKIVACTKAAS